MRENTREHDYTIEAIVLINQLIIILSLWRVLMSALDKKFQLSKEPLPKVLNPLWAGQLQRMCSIVFNSASSQHTLQQFGRDLLQVFVSDLISLCPIINPIANLIYAQQPTSTYNVYNRPQTTGNKSTRYIPPKHLLFSQTNPFKRPQRCQIVGSGLRK